MNNTVLFILCCVAIQFSNNTLLANNIANDTYITTTDNNISKTHTEKCSNFFVKKSLLSGWILSEPYQFMTVTANGQKITGMDIDILNAIAEKLNLTIEYKKTNWHAYWKPLKDGNRDVLGGMTYTKNRENFAYFSIPYRFEENSLYINSNTQKQLQFNSIGECLTQIRLNHFRIGVINNFIYADPQINNFIHDMANNDIVYFYKNDYQAISALNKGIIDGMISDKTITSYLLVKERLTSHIKEIPLNIKTPVHFVFNKDSVPLTVVTNFNKEIKKFIQSKEYKDIVKIHLYPVILIQIIGTNWFYIICIIGTIAFAISAIIISAKDNTSLFVTILFAILPSIGIGIIRDIIINGKEKGVFLTPSYIYFISIIVLFGFFTIRLLEYYNRHNNEKNHLSKLLNNLLIITDAIGQSAFIIIGVSLVIITRVEPIILWGPIFGFISANTGSIIRDLLHNKNNIICLYNTPNAEISVLWSLILSIYLDINSYQPEPDKISNMMIITVIGAVITRLLIFYLKFPNTQLKNH